MSGGGTVLARGVCLVQRPRAAALHVRPRRRESQLGQVARGVQGLGPEGAAALALAHGGARGVRPRRARPRPHPGRADVAARTGTKTSRCLRDAAARRAGVFLKKFEAGPTWRSFTARRSRLEALRMVLAAFYYYGDHRDLHYPLRRQRQMCIRDSIHSIQERNSCTLYTDYNAPDCNGCTGLCHTYIIIGLSLIHI